MASSSFFPSSFSIQPLLGAKRKDTTKNQPEDPLKQQQQQQQQQQQHGRSCPHAGRWLILAVLVCYGWAMSFWVTINTTTITTGSVVNLSSSSTVEEENVSLLLSSTAAVASISQKADATDETTYERDQDEKEAEELLNSQCKKVEHLCYSTGRWWFKSVSNLTAASQPNLIVKIHDGKVAFPRTIEVGPETLELSTIQCPYSPIANHVSVAAVYNEMLGEFYSRDLVGLALMLEKSSLLSQAQVYLHLWNLDRRILDSQRAFMAPFVRHHVLDFRELL